MFLVIFVFLVVNKLGKSRLVVSQQPRGYFWARRTPAEDCNDSYNAKDKENAKRTGCTLIVNSDDLLP